MKQQKHQRQEDWHDPASSCTASSSSSSSSSTPTSSPLAAAIMLACSSSFSSADPSPQQSRQSPEPSKQNHDSQTQTQPTTSTTTTSFLTALIAGGMAGTSVDIALFPIDTIKTRLQSPQGFQAAGGFRGVYNGLGAAAVGSAPGAALFFSTYETTKPWLLEQSYYLQEHPSIAHMVAASLGEAAACLVRVPTEVIKAKMQTNKEHATSLKNTVQLVWNETHGGSPLSQKVTGGLYRGYGITLMREIPFAMIQFPLYEQLKVYWAEQYRDGIPVNPVEAAACGSFSGGIAAAVTTPLDVIKTRIMLGVDKHGQRYNGVGDVWRKTRQEGYSVFFSGIQPRVMWISIGGFVFFGAYEGFKSVLSPILQQ